LNFDTIVAELKREQDRIGRAINALLEGAGLTGPSKQSARKSAASKRGGGITPAGRKRLAAAMKARWAARKAKSATSGKVVSAVKAAAPKKRGGGMTPAGRKRLSEAMKKRWAEKKKKAS
jgi:hypothetical protein